MIDLQKMKRISERSYLLRCAPLISNVEFDTMIDEIEELREEVEYLEGKLESCTEFESPMLDYGDIPPLKERIQKAKEYHARKNKKDVVD